MNQYTTLPDDLPVPQDDGACDHLTGQRLPDVSLNATSGCAVKLSELGPQTVLYFYPMTGVPGVSLPDGWDQIPGARGCTPQSCSFRDHKQELSQFHTQVFGISAQSTPYQLEAKERLHLPFDLLSDQELILKDRLALPSFTVQDMELYKRVTLIILNDRIAKVFYPVFPPDKNAEQVINWLKQNH